MFFFNTYIITVEPVLRSSTATLGPNLFRRTEIRRSLYGDWTDKSLWPLNGGGRIEV